MLVVNQLRITRLTKRTKLKLNKKVEASESLGLSRERERGENNKTKRIIQMVNKLHKIKASIQIDSLAEEFMIWFHLGSLAHLMTKVRQT